jgi:hypothetical protein
MTVATSSGENARKLASSSTINNQIITSMNGMTKLCCHSINFFNPDAGWRYYLQNTPAASARGQHQTQPARAVQRCRSQAISIRHLNLYLTVEGFTVYEIPHPPLV